MLLHRSPSSCLSLWAAVVALRARGVCVCGGGGGALPTPFFACTLATLDQHRCCCRCFRRLRSRSIVREYERASVESASERSVRGDTAPRRRTRRRHGIREEEAGREESEDVARAGLATGQQGVLRLPTAWTHLREHDNRLFCLHNLFGHAVSIVCGRSKV